MARGGKMKGKCWLKVRSFDGGVEIGGIEGQEWDDENYVGPLRLLVDSDEDASAVFFALKDLVDKFGRYAQDFCEDWAFAVAKEMKGSEFCRKIDKVGYLPNWELLFPWDALKKKKVFRLEGRNGVLVFPSDAFPWREER